MAVTPERLGGWNPGFAVPVPNPAAIKCGASFEGGSGQASRWCLDWWWRAWWWNMVAMTRHYDGGLPSARCCAAWWGRWDMVEAVRHSDGRGGCATWL